MRTQERPVREWTDRDDALLAAILALRERWNARDGRLTLADLELDTTLAILVVSGLCPRHGQFVTEWAGRRSDAFPLEARCPAGDRGRCAETSPVYVLV
jgi:hypothetical protein